MQPVANGLGPGNVDIFRMPRFWCKRDYGFVESWGNFHTIPNNGNVEIEVPDLLRTDLRAKHLKVASTVTHLLKETDEQLSTSVNTNNVVMVPLITKNPMANKST